MTAQQLIVQLQLERHPEGGFYKEVYRTAATIAPGNLPGIDGERNYCTSIYYLLQDGDFSAFQRIKSDEIWHFYAGGTLQLHLLDMQFGYQCFSLGNTLTDGAQFQVLMPANVWFAAEPAPGTDFTLAGCTVAPGFDFRDFEMAEKSALRQDFPQQALLIDRLCR
jgi:predicted cupin superfamily sugar epimerase